MIGTRPYPGGSAGGEAGPDAGGYVTEDEADFHATLMVKDVRAMAHRWVTEPLRWAVDATDRKRHSITPTSSIFS